jgi:hypothetical protein
VQVDFQISKVRIRPASSQYGLGFFIEGKVLQSNRPELVGSERCMKIDGFANIKAQKSALNDLKNFMTVALASRGLTMAWAGDWGGAAIQMAEQDWCVGVRVFAQTALTAPSQANGKQKLIQKFAPAA